MNIPKDKKLHLIMGTSMGLLYPLVVPLVWAICLGLFVALMKEVLDWVSNRVSEIHGEPTQHSVDPKDFVWTALGVALGAAIFSTLHGAIHHV